MSARRAPGNRSLVISRSDRRVLGQQLLTLTNRSSLATVCDRVLLHDVHTAAPLLPACSVDLLVADPPYNRTKSFGGTTFRGVSSDAYGEWTERWLASVLHTLKPGASVYICADWRSSGAVQKVVERLLVVRNRITWEREKGRGAARNWKDCSEDIWFCTVGDSYTFNLDAVKLKRRVRAPYVDANGKPKDWHDDGSARFRNTSPSNLWTDLTVPFWSMPENTAHPAQKPEKMLAKIILASSNAGDVVLDPFLGSGTTAVVARKLGRHFIGIESEREYCLMAAKRLSSAEQGGTIQGFEDGVFLERNFRG